MVVSFSSFCLTEANRTKGAPKPLTEVEYTDEFMEWWNTLSEDDQDTVVSPLVKLLMEQGVALGFPYSSAIKKSRHAMRELREQHGDLTRIFYCFTPSRSALLLSGAKKKGYPGSMDRFYDYYVPIADDIFDEYLIEIGQPDAHAQMDRFARRSATR